MSSFNKISVLNGRIEAIVYNENTIIQKKFYVLEEKDTAYFSFYGFSFPQFNLTVTLSYKNINLQKREIRNCVLQRSMIGFPF